MRGPYDDIIDLPRHVSRTHPQMPMEERAAQFSPFAALTGYGDVIQETARPTDARPELSESRQEEIKRRLDALAEQAAGRPRIAVTFFLQDARKKGGAIVTAAGRLERLDEAEHVLRLEDGTCVPVRDILGIEAHWTKDILAGEEENG